MLIDEAMKEMAEEELMDGLDDLEEPIKNSANFRIEDMLPNLDFILSETGDGSIEDYLEHPLNSRKSKGIAQILRGMTGLLGNLNYAVLDICLGFFEFSKEKGLKNEEPINAE